MNRGVSCGGGKSSLGYLFESAEAATSSAPSSAEHQQQKPPSVDPDADGKPKAESQIRSEPDAPENPLPRRREEQGPTKSEGGFITLGRPSTKVQSVPGGRSSLGYLFGDK